jgi:hypothetical protein
LSFVIEYEKDVTGVREPPNLSVLARKHRLRKHHIFSDPLSITVVLLHNLFERSPTLHYGSYILVRPNGLFSRSD